MALELHTTTNSEVEGIGQGSPLKVAQQSTVFRLPSPVCKSNLEAYPLHVASPELLADAELHGHPNAKPLQKSGWYEHAQRRNIQAQHDMGRHSTTRTDTTRHGRHSTTRAGMGKYGQAEWRTYRLPRTKRQCTSASHVVQVRVELQCKQYSLLTCKRMPMAATVTAPKWPAIKTIDCRQRSEDTS